MLSLLDRDGLSPQGREGRESPCHPRGQEGGRGLSQEQAGSGLKGFSGSVSWADTRLCEPSGRLPRHQGTQRTYHGLVAVVFPQALNHSFFRAVAK